jgi:hypothetical protein
MMMRRLLLVLAIGVTACGASEKKVDLAGEWPSTVRTYPEVVQEWTRRERLRDAYQETLELSGTLKSPEWYAAFGERDADNRGLVGEAREQRRAQAKADAAGPYEVELLVTTWDRRENDLDRGQKSVWKVNLLDAAGKEIPPLEIIKDKRPGYVIRAEFPDLGDFATAYLARFPREANLFGPNARQVRLRMSSPRGGVTLTWDSK